MCSLTKGHKPYENVSYYVFPEGSGLETYSSAYGARWLRARAACAAPTGSAQPQPRLPRPSSARASTLSVGPCRRAHRPRRAAEVGCTAFSAQRCVGGAFSEERFSGAYPDERATSGTPFKRQSLRDMMWGKTDWIKSTFIRDPLSR